MKKWFTGILVVMGMFAAFVAIKPADASAATVPSSLRHAWYLNLATTKKDPEFVKFGTHSIDTGNKGFHNKISGSNLSVKKRAKGWYEIGYKGNKNSTYKATKKKINGVKRTVLLKRYLGNSHVADVFMLGRKHILPLNDSTVFL